MSPMFLLSVVMLAVLCSKLNAHPSFQRKIPNGDMIPNPCNRSMPWGGVGHKKSAGSGPLNPFGMDFNANNYVWDRTLCQKDSDGDGMTNGQELGDPNCTWMEGSTPELRTNLSHPGVCEPLNSTLCSGKNSWLMNCTMGKFDCPAINASGVRNITLRFPPTPIPAKETTYMCHRFKLPNDSVADVIAIKPVLDNAHILHHMLLYACIDDPNNRPDDKPFECGMGDQMKCLSLIGIAGTGDWEQCLHNEVGFRIGPGGFQYAVLQLHWNNPDQKMNLTDSSGMIIYYTTQLRPNAGQVIMIGQNYLEIPSGQMEVTQMGGCSSSCTKHLPHSVFLTSALLHMHKMGKSGDIRLSRNGKLLQVLDDVHKYDYDTPTMVEFATPIEVKPGDEIQVKCVYQSIGKNSTTYYGLATSEEMCFGFITYYPLVPDLSYCGQWKTINICSSKGGTEFGSCDFSTVMKLVSVLPTVCAENCKSTACALLMDGLLATGCHSFPHVKQFVDVFMPINGEVFQRCATERLPKPLCTQAAVSNSLVLTASLGFGLIFSLMAYAASN